MLFYLGCLLHPHDMKRSADHFKDFAPNGDMKQLRATIQKCHEALYKYSHERMRFFASVKDLAYLFSLYFSQGSNAESSDAKLNEALCVIRDECKRTLSQ